MKSIQSRGLNLNNKKILIRLDLNVPLNGTNITDTNRIDKTIPTLQYLLKNKAKIIILSHIGRPKGKIVNELSLKPVCNELEKKRNIENLQLSHPQSIFIVGMPRSGTTLVESILSLN